MWRRVLSRDDPATGHIRLTYQQKQMKLILGGWSKILPAGASKGQESGSKYRPTGKRMEMEGTDDWKLHALSFQELLRHEKWKQRSRRLRPLANRHR
jgi:hypothetical protein